VSISYEILGEPGRDNAVLASVNTGQSQHRLLFDCGEGCLRDVPRSDVQTIEVVFFSHFHIDHVAGFDGFFRLNWYRAGEPVRIFGPASARNIIQHRMQGITWNLVEGPGGEVHVSELVAGTVCTSRYFAEEGFSREHPLPVVPCDGLAYRGHGFRVEVRETYHGIPSLAYLLREDDRHNVDKQVLAAEGLAPGPWLKQLKQSDIPCDTCIELNGRQYRLGSLRERLLCRTPGDSLAYLTDFRLQSQQDEDDLVAMLAGCKILICENNFRDADAELARFSHHMASADVGRLAARVQPEMLVLFHVSDRYTPAEWREQLAEVRRRFGRAVFPERWKLPD